MKQAKKKKPAPAKVKGTPDRRVRDRKSPEARRASATTAKTAAPKKAPKSAAAARTKSPARPSVPKPALKAAPRPSARAVVKPKPPLKAIKAAPKPVRKAASKPAAAPKPAQVRPAVAPAEPKKPGRTAPPKPPAPPAAVSPPEEIVVPAEPAPAAAAQPEPQAPPVAAKEKPLKRPPKKEPKAPAKSKSKKKDDDEKSLVKFDPLQRYLSEISKYRLLTRDEERDYGIRVKEQGDKDAAYALVTANLRLVVKIALEFQRVWMQNLLDLIQEGNIGLMQAVKKFDPYKNVKFSYYASFWIKAYILKFIMDNWRLVKIGTTQGQRKLFFKLKKEKQRLIDQGFDPKPKLLSERLGVSEREIVDMDQRLDGWDVSLDAPLKNDSETERIEFLSTDAESVEEQVSKKEIELLLHNKISEFRKKMSPREVEIFELRIFSDNPVTLQEIGDRYGISRERVRQIEKNIIRKMREFFKREIPDFASYSEDTGME
jgi:RNA polymerase sigma-32 factor